MLKNICTPKAILLTGLANKASIIFHGFIVRWNLGHKLNIIHSFWAHFTKKKKKENENHNCFKKSGYIAAAFFVRYFSNSLWAFVILKVKHQSSHDFWVLRKLISRGKWHVAASAPISYECASMWYSTLLCLKIKKILQSCLLERERNSCSRQSKRKPIEIVPIFRGQFFGREVYENISWFQKLKIVLLK